MMKHRILLVAGLGLLAGSVSAQTLYSTTFEEFSMGSIDGQHGWLSTDTGIAITGAEAGVTPFSGDQMVRFPTTTEVNFANYAWRDVTAAWGARDAGHQIARASVRLFIPESIGAEYEFGLAAWSGQTWLAEAMVNTATNTIWLYSPAVGGIVNTGVSPSRNEWNLLQVYLDYSSGQLTASLNGVWVGESTPFDTSESFTDYTLSAYTFDGVANLNAYYDDFSMEAVPEPASLAALAAGVAALIARRRRSRA
jgi:hypothetical protein